jgi:multidrug efflux pump
VIGGMITATLLAVFLVPVFYVVVRTIFKGRTGPPSAAAETGKQSSSSAAENPSAP